MYSFELNIGSLASPVSGGGWVAVNPEFNKASIDYSIEDEEIFARKKLTGNIQFLYTEFTSLDLLRQAVAKCPVRLKKSSTVIFEGELDLWGDYKENICGLKVSSDDRYTLLLTDKSTKVNILNSTPATYCDVAFEFDALSFSYSSSFAQSALWTSPSGVPSIYARQEVVLADHTADALDGSGGWAIISTNPDDTKTLARTWVDGGYAAPTPTDYVIRFPSEGSSLSLNDQLVISGKQCTFLGVSVAVDPEDDYDLFLDNKEYYTADTITYSRFRKLKSVIEYLVTRFDTTIVFNDDSWVYLDAHEDLQHLLIANVSDLISQGTPPLETTSGQEVGNMTFQKLMEMLRKKAKLYWLIEETEGQKYFKLKHRSEINYVVGTLNLTDYADFDYTRDAWKYNQSEKFNRLERVVTGGNFDFLGTDILIPSLDNVAEPKVLGDEKWHFDIWDILSRGSAFYQADSKDEFSMVTAEPIKTDGVELLSGFTNGGYTSFNYSAGTLVASAASGGNCYSNSISPVKGYLYKVQFNLVYTDQAPNCQLTGTDMPLTRGVAGINTFYFVATDDSNLVLRFANSIGFMSNFTMSDLTVERWIYNIRIGEGALSGQRYANVELSVANLDAGHGQYELPDRNCTINLAVVALVDNQLLKDKEQTTQCPLHSPDDVDPEELFVTNKGNLEFMSLTIPLSGDTSDLIGRFL